jgi:hypothetical protein
MTLTSTILDSLTTNTGINKTPGDAYQGIREIQLDNSYVTNGYAITPAICGLSRLTKFVPMCLGPSLSAGIGDFSYDRANGKVKLYTAAGVEVANAVDASAVKLYAFVEGYL